MPKPTKKITFDKQKAFARIILIASTDYLHPDYKYTTDLRSEYLAHMTGQNTTELFRRFDMRESEAMFQQRMLISQLINMSVVNALINPYRKVSKVKPLFKIADYAANTDKPEDTQKLKARREELEGAINSFYGESDVDGYINLETTPICNYDPNSFTLMTFDEFDPLKEKADPYTVIIPCTEIADFKYRNNFLEYLVQFWEIDIASAEEIPEKPVKKVKNNEVRNDDAKGPIMLGKAKKYLLRAANDEIVVTPMDPRLAKGHTPLNQLFTLSDNGFSAGAIEILQTKPGERYYFKTEDKKLYEVIFFEPKSKMVPAKRNGFIMDPHTRNRTCLAPWHPAITYLRRAVKTISELDLTSSIHVFPQKFEYVRACPGKGKKKCQGGWTVEGDECERCGGTGTLSHKSSQDVQTLPMPTNKDQLMDLSKLVHYVELPIELIKWMHEYSKELRNDCFLAMFNSQQFKKPTGTTATEVLVDYDSVTDALLPFTEFYSSMWVFLVTMEAIYLQLDDNLIVEHKFPRRFRFESVTDLIGQMTAAKNAGVASDVLAEIEWNLIDQLFTDQPVRFQEIKVKRKLNPFEGKTENMIQSLINSAYVTRRVKVLYSMFKPIMDDLDAEAMAGESKTSYFLLPEAEQRKLLIVKIDAVIVQLDAEVAKAVGFNDPKLVDASGNPIDPGAAQK